MDTDLSTWLRMQSAPEPLVLALLAIARACTNISAVTADGALNTFEHEEPDQTRSALEVFAHNELVRALAPCTAVAGWASEGRAEPEMSPLHAASGQLFVSFDPLDAASNVGANIAYGSIFSILPQLLHGTEPRSIAFLQPGSRQLAAGYVIYGPSTVLVLSVGGEVCEFTLERRTQRWLLTRARIQVPARTRELAINVANMRYWEPPVQRYIYECLSGDAGPRRASFNMRWAGSLAADVHRILMRGGVYLYPRDEQEPRQPGRLRLLHHAAPMAFLMERAGAAASTGTCALLEIEAGALHQCVPLILGSRDEVERIVAYHEDPHENVSMQLFRTRSLFVTART